MPATIRRATADDSAQIVEIIGEAITESNPVAFGERALSSPSAIGAVAPLTSPGTSFRPPIHEEHE